MTLPDRIVVGAAATPNVFQPALFSSESRGSRLAARESRDDLPSQTSTMSDSDYINESFIYGLALGLLKRNGDVADYPDFARKYFRDERANDTASRRSMILAGILSDYVSVSEFEIPSV